MNGLLDLLCEEEIKRTVVRLCNGMYNLCGLRGTCKLARKLLEAPRHFYDTETMLLTGAKEESMDLCITAERSGATAFFKASCKAAKHGRYDEFVYCLRKTPMWYTGRWQLQRYGLSAICTLLGYAVEGGSASIVDFMTKYYTDRCLISQFLYRKALESGHGDVALRATMEIARLLRHTLEEEFGDRARGTIDHFSLFIYVCRIYGCTGDERWLQIVNIMCSVFEDRHVDYTTVKNQEIAIGAIQGNRVDIFERHFQAIENNMDATWQCYRATVLHRNERLRKLLRQKVEDSAVIDKDGIGIFVEAAQAGDVDFCVRCIEDRGADPNLLLYYGAAGNNISACLAASAHGANSYDRVLETAICQHKKNICSFALAHGASIVTWDIQDVWNTGEMRIFRMIVDEYGRRFTKAIKCGSINHEMLSNFGYSNAATLRADVINMGGEPGERIKIDFLYALFGSQVNAAAFETTYCMAVEPECYETKMTNLLQTFTHPCRFERSAEDPEIIYIS